MNLTIGGQRDNAMKPSEKKIVSSILNDINQYESCTRNQISYYEGLKDIVEALKIISTKVSSKELKYQIQKLCQFDVSKLVGDEHTVECFWYELSEIESLLRNESTEKKVIVFLPYNASMWDSMESVWIAAKNDNRCDTYVVPIPYYDKNPDGTFGNMHYEGNLLPSYVPITKWDSFDIEEEEPDVVYIHNPYDELNLVTSVEPRFYSHNLKKYVNKLVYIPYFLFVNDSATESMVWTRGVINADYVVFQSKKTCREAISIFNRLRHEQKLENVIGGAEQRFLDLGSPIQDKIVSDTIYDIPFEWKQKIFVGKVKKLVVFYNTHLTDVMGGNVDSFFKKISYVFKIFKNNQNVVLLWRPHPLTLETIRAINPSVETQYLKIVENYKYEGWGIYDDTSDLNRSISIADAYFGDWSSVVTMFQMAKKPVMLQNMEITCENQSEVLKVSCYKICDHDVYFCLDGWNGLFQYDLKMQKLELLVKFGNESSNGKALYSSIHVYKDKVYMIPFNASKIAYYDLGSKDVTYLDLPDDYNIACKLYDSVEYGESVLWLFPTCYPYFLRIDMETDSIEYLSRKELDITSVNKNSQEVLYFGVCGGYKSMAVLEQYMTNNIHLFDMEAKTMKRICLDTQSYFIGMWNRKEIFYFLEKNSGRVYSYDLHTENLKIRDIDYTNLSSEEKENLLSGKNGYSVHCIECLDKIWLIPTYQPIIVYIDKETKMAHKFESDAITNKLQSGPCLVENKLFMFRDEEILLWDDAKIDYIKMDTMANVLEENYALPNEIGRIVYENNIIFSIRDLLEYRDLNSIGIAQKESNGEKVHNFVMDKLGLEGNM